MNSKRKGAVGERELARFLRENGHEARRGRQYSGNPDSPDVVSSLEGFHIECKRTERFNVWAAMQQAAGDAGEKTPVVFARRNRSRWLAVVPAEAFLAIVGGRAGDGTASPEETEGP